MTLKAKIGGFMDFLAISGCDTSFTRWSHHQPRNYLYVHFGMTVIKVLYFIANSRKFNSNSDRNFSLYDFVVL